MADMTVLDSHEFVMLSGDELVTDSRKVAKHFGRQHRDVLRSIRKVNCSEEFRLRNFAQCYEINKLSKKPEPYYTMTKDGFVFLVMGFSGSRADSIKEAYITAFNQMAEQLQRRDMGLWQQMQAQIAKEVDSQVRASFGSHLMLRRKREIPRLREEMEQLEHEMQPSLFLN